MTDIASRWGSVFVGGSEIPGSDPHFGGTTLPTADQTNSALGHVRSDAPSPILNLTERYILNEADWTMSSFSFESSPGDVFLFLLVCLQFHPRNKTHSTSEEDRLFNYWCSVHLCFIRALSKMRSHDFREGNYEAVTKSRFGGKKEIKKKKNIEDASSTLRGDNNKNRMAFDNGRIFCRDEESGVYGNGKVVVVGGEQ
ncbi:hypothetical protein C0J52_12593 [Blattella germanica]|nr:hypothetical protein C0J52_12593 [Blattella germanica]